MENQMFMHGSSNLEKLPCTDTFSAGGTRQLTLTHNPVDPRHFEPLHRFCCTKNPKTSSPSTSSQNEEDKTL